MTATLIVAVIVSASLVVGALWGAVFSLSDRVRGLLLAGAGGALITSISFELIEPSVEDGGVLVASVGLLIGAIVFTGVDYQIDERWDSEGGGGILAAVTLDGIPENLSLGVAMIGAGPKSVAALAAAIFASNLPEAAGGASDLVDAGWTRRRVLGLWSATAVLLALAAIGGFFFIGGASGGLLAAIRSFAAGAVLASLATEVFPQAFSDSSHGAGVATACGFVLTFALGAL